MDGTPIALGYQNAAAVDASGPATSSYTALLCITALQPPKRVGAEIRTPCLTSSEDDVEAGTRMTEPATFSIKHKTASDFDTLHDLSEAKTIKQWRILNTDSSVWVFDGFLAEVGQQAIERNKAVQHDFKIIVTRYWGFYTAHPS